MYSESMSKENGYDNKKLLVTGKSRTQIMKRGSLGEVFGVSNHCNKTRGSRRRRGLPHVLLRGCHGLVAVLSWMSRGNRHNGISA